jgi:hypothetical protein
MNAAQRKSLAQRNGKRGGLARVKKMKSTLQGQEQMRRNALKSCERQTAIYQGLFVNRSGIKRVNEARKQARINGGKASQQAQRAKKSARAGEVPRETATIPVTYNPQKTQEQSGGAVVYRG